MWRFTLLLLLAVGSQSRPQATTNNQAPVVSITMENYAEIMPSGTEVRLQVQANDPDGTVQWVRLNQNGQPAGGIILGSSGTFTAIIREGANTFQAQALDNSGSPGFSTSIHVRGNLRPDVTIVEPKPPITLYSLTNAVTIRVEAYDVDNTVAEVRLLHNGTLLASDYQAPYEFLFKPSAFGTHTLEVQAIDSLGATSSTTVVVNYVRIFDDYGPGITASTGTNVTLRGTTVDATRQKGEPNHAGASGGRSIWFAWRPTVHGTVTIDTYGSDFDTVLGVYTNSPFLATTPITNLVSVAANDDDDANAPLSRVKFMAVANQTVYYIAVDGRDGFAGNVVLNIRQTQNRVPLNDYIAGAIRVGGTITQVSTNIGATKEPGEPMHAGNVGGSSLWWRIDTFDAAGIQITTSNSTFDTVLAVYTNSFSSRTVEAGIPLMESLRLVTANDDFGNSTNRTSRVEFTPRPGTTYWVAVDGYNGAEGIIRIAFARQSLQGSRPANDAFTQPALLRGSSALTNVNTFLATSEFNEPAEIAAPGGGKSVWYRWVAPATGPVYVSTKWSDFDTLLAVYTGTNITRLLHIASNDDDGGLQTSALVFNALEGTEYRIAVAGYRNAGGDLVLTLNQPRLVLPRIVTTTGPGRITFGVQDVTGSFVLQESSDLVNWVDAGTALAAEAEVEIVPQEGVKQLFYRVRQVE